MRTYLPLFVVFGLAAAACSEAQDTVPSTEPAQTVARDAATPGEATEELTLGDEAPALSIADWVKGEKVEKFEDGRVYVVEFWATWCPPCRASMPHLSELQQKYREEATMIGVTDEGVDTVTGFFAQDSPFAADSATETSAESDEQASDEAEEPENKSWDEVVEYTIAVDESNETTRAYMEASGQQGIPAAFIVGKDGKIEWMGHPMEIDSPLGAVIDGSWDREAAIKEMQERKRAEEAQRTAFREIQLAVQSDDYEAALSIVDNLVEEFPDNEAFPMMRLQILRMSGETQKLAEAIEAKAAEVGDDASRLDGLVWMFVGRGSGSDLPFDTLEKIATKAAELTDYKNGSVLDTLARVHYRAGDLEKAVEVQKKAVAVGGDMTEQLQKTLEQYQAELEGESAQEDEEN